MASVQHDDIPHFDVLIIGAGLSGIGTACHITNTFPKKTITLLERRETLGGTWDLFNYPGIRSDSDMLTFGYNFRPWNKLHTLADGPAIKQYISDTADEFGVTEKIQFGVKTLSANWDSESRCWTVIALHEKSGEKRQYTCGYFISCTGYYDQDAGYRPTFPNEECFKGRKIHPQHWPKDLNYKDKNVVIIGSGATAVTLMPAMANDAARVTMLQRSPSYIFSVPSEDKMTEMLQRILPKQWAFKLARKRNLALQRGIYLACRRWPNFMKKYLLSHVRKHVGDSVDMRHFTPKYMPWDERLCSVPDADLFNAIRSRKAAIETGEIASFTENGITMKDGRTLQADIIITATGLNLLTLGGIKVSVDNTPCSFSEKMTYKSVLIEGMPNMAWIFGYVNASWTLKADISATYLCRLFKYMQNNDFEVVVPEDHDNCALDDGVMDSLQAGYVQRGKHQLPRQGAKYPWKVTMHYGKDRKMLLNDPIEDAALHFFKKENSMCKAAPQKNINTREASA
ncbi:NAD(P)/FAD-dependent oxidoreductase [Alteromonas sp. CI.11.F.A3]|uniref:flavin-containing monooxygenase n=1 Tax=Alteromonas sp. CI.11.F.A3 TaxID=3079555 RepID=UPI002943B212|nr:NAD(P)/FAD-dependent oxidoreductase [Alteromonas sp. CI.11.F.A3]WOI38615.1 NAD(P)/FAD-dependent oxidoreductase [Alteromonas sp. CI.11.F.A3]